MVAHIIVQQKRERVRTKTALKQLRCYAMYTSPTNLQVHHYIEEESMMINTCQKRRRRTLLSRHHLLSATFLSLLLILKSTHLMTHAFPTTASWKRRPRRRDSSFHHMDLFMTFNKDNSNKKFLSRRTFGLLAAAGGVVGLVTAAGEVYARVASLNIKDDKVTLYPNILQDLSSVKEVTIIFHGAGGPDEYTDKLVQMLKRNSSAKKAVAIMVQWQDYSSNLLQASANGKVIGRRIAQKLLSSSNSSSLERIHVIGISVGAFAADSLCTVVKKERPSIYIQETLLDPFQQSGIVDITYGKRNFGKYADYAQQYLNTVSEVRFLLLWLLLSELFVGK